MSAPVMAESLLEKLVKGVEEAQSMLVQDTCQQSGRLLVKSVAVQCLQRFSSVHLFLFDLHPLKWFQGIPQDLCQRLTVHDCYSDHLGWNGDTASGSTPLHVATLTTFLQEVGGVGDNKATPTTSHQQEMGGVRTGDAVVLDSLSTLLLFHNATHICKLIHDLGRRCGLVVCLLHGDVHDSHVISQLCHVISSTIEVNPIPPSLQADYTLEVKLSHRRRSGRLLQATEYVAIDNTLEISATASHEGHSHWKGPEELAPDPTANLTFNLSLNEREKRERSQLVLPYHHTSEKKTAALQAGAGKIFYQPDEADDFDDSDPDEDLDI